VRAASASACATAMVSGMPSASGAGAMVVLSNYGAAIVNGCCMPVSLTRFARSTSRSARGSDRCAYSLCCGPLLADGKTFPARALARAACLSCSASSCRACTVLASVR